MPRIQPRKFCFFLLFFSLGAEAANTQKCLPLRQSLAIVKNPLGEPEARSFQANCLVQQSLDNQEVVRTVLRILRDSQEDFILREDVVRAFAALQWRKKIKVEGMARAKLDSQEQRAVDHTISEASDIIALTQKVKSMEEVVSATPFEVEIFWALAEVASREDSPVLLRAAAVEALERGTRKIVSSGLYEEKILQLTHHTLSSFGEREDDLGYFTGAGLAYQRLVAAGTPFFSPAKIDEPRKTGRALASELKISSPTK